MTMTLQVLYDATDGSTFDHAYYATTHMGIVSEHMGPHMASSVIVKGLAGGPDVPSPFHAIATMVFADQAALDAAMGAAGPALEDIPKFYSGQPTMVVGQTIA